MFRYALRSLAGDDLGEHVTIIASWNVGDPVIRSGHELYTVANVVDLSDSEDETGVRGILYIEPLE